MAPRRLYIAGPLEAVGYDHNAFGKAHQQLLDAGYQVRNPVQVLLRDSREERERDRLWLLLECTGVAVLDGWQMSDIATFEVLVAARGLRLPVLTVARWIEIAP